MYINTYAWHYVHTMFITRVMISDKTLHRNNTAKVIDRLFSSIPVISNVYTESIAEFLPAITRFCQT